MSVNVKIDPNPQYLIYPTLIIIIFIIVANIIHIVIVIASNLLL